jgi:hypothetical protein
MYDGAFGLGNRLFQICAAIHYCETYGYSIVIRKTMSTLFGTSKCYTFLLIINTFTLSHVHTKYIQMYIFIIIYKAVRATNPLLFFAKIFFVLLLVILSCIFSLYYSKRKWTC